MELNEFTKELGERYPDLGISKIEVDEQNGQSTLYMSPKKTHPMIDDPQSLVKQRTERGSTISRRVLDRNSVDYLGSSSPSAENPQNLYKKADTYYKEEPFVGSAINLLTSLACKGFENDIDDDEIKEFYDVWAYDVGLHSILENIFLDFFKVGQVNIYKTLGSYEPRDSDLSPIPGVSIESSEVDNKTKSYKEVADKILKEVLDSARQMGLKGNNLTAVEKAAKKKLDYGDKIPVGYTILNPELVTIEGSLLFDSYTVELSAPSDLVDLLGKEPKDQTPQEKEVLKKLPKDFKDEIKNKGSHTLDPVLVDQISYRKQPYERYGLPRMTKIFDSLEYKKALRQADLSTLDGISNYILKITVGNDEYPVTSQQELETVAKLFDTPSKSFDVVWNHTLNIEKITSPEIEAVLGQDKYKQVNDDISVGLAVSRALLDGQGDVSANQLNVLLKGLKEEINYARRQVSRWLYREYSRIAEVVGFSKYPKIRWDDSILKDTIAYMNVVANLVDRRMLSYKTAHEALGFDYPTELNNMEKEFAYVRDGIFGIIGSPWQQSGGNGNTQDVQNTPKGTPSKGRPPNQPSKEKTNDKKNSGSIDFSQSKDLVKIVKDMPDEEYDNFINFLSKIRNEDKDSF